VIGVGVKESTSDLLIATCDEFIFYDDLVRESGRQSMRREQRPAQDKGRKPAPASGNPEDDRRREEAQARRDKAVELALQTFEALYAERGETGKIWASVLKEAIKRRKPDFSESYYGFRSFGGLLEEMQSRGFLKMARDEKSNSYVFRSGGAEASQGASTEPAAPEVLPITHRAGETEPRGRAGRGRGSRREASQRHDFEPTLAVETPQSAPVWPEDEDDDAAERFADAARAAMVTRDVNPPAEPAPDAETYVSDTAVEAEEAAQAEEASAPRESGSRRGGRGGRGRGAARKNAGEQAPAAAPAATPPAAETIAAAPAPAVKTPRARKTAAAKTAPAKKAAPRPARKTKAAAE
jgi:hypothetical protein